MWSIPLTISAVLPFLAAPALWAQAPATRPMPASAYKLISVEVTGSERYTSAEIAAASGLPVGTVAHEADFQKAARQLGDSGAFSDVAFTYTYSSAGTKLLFHVTDEDKLVPARFADFVWFTDEELLKRLHERIPLFKGELPTHGRLPDEVSDVLQAMLVENGIPGHVEYQRKSGKNDSAESVDYSVAGVSIRIHHAEFPGAGPAELTVLNAAAEKLTDREYSRDYMVNFTEHTVLPIFHEHGYLKASCAPARPKVIKLADSQLDLNRQPRTFVDVTFPIAAGIQYKLTSWDWMGNKEIGSDSSQSLLHIKAGEPANLIQLHEDLRAVQELYGSHGFVAVAIKANAQFDDGAGTVAFHLEVAEGPVFHMGELEFRGLDNTLTARLRAAWKLRPGDVYDASYLKEFLAQARKLLPANLDWDVDPHVTALAQSRTVDVDLQYTAKAPR